MSLSGLSFGSAVAVFNFNSATLGLNKSINRLSSGSRIADVSDDAAGAAVAGKFDAAVKRLSAISQSTQVLISLAQTTDGFLSTIEAQLSRMSELATRATNGAFSASDRANYSVEFEELTTNITNQVTNSKFNGSAVFGTSGTITASVSQDASDIFSMALRNLNDASGGSMNGINALDITTTSGASAAVNRLTTILENVATDRANVNADIASLNFQVEKIEAEELNTDTASSRIKDLDFAEESTRLAKFSIMTQSGALVLAQANTSLENVLTLLR